MAGDLTMVNSEHGIILQLNELLPPLMRRSEHLVDRTHPEYRSSREHVDAGVQQIEALLARLKQARPA